jgi:hypothetical protein
MFEVDQQNWGFAWEKNADGINSSFSEIFIDTAASAHLLGPKMTPITTNEMIAELALAVLGPDTSAREKYVLKQALLALVQLAKSECRVQLCELIAKAANERISEKPRRSAGLLSPEAPARTLH